MTYFSESEQQEELVELLTALCHIPAPSGQEQRRAAFIQNWLREECGLTAILDEALNVLVPFSFPLHGADQEPEASRFCRTADASNRFCHAADVTDLFSRTADASNRFCRAADVADRSCHAADAADRPAMLFMAHTDTVFPDQEEMPVYRDKDRLCSPGVGDDTACVAILMLYLKYKKQALLSCKKPLLFAFNSCEEGLGNLKGSRQILNDYGRLLGEVTSFDGGVKGICNHAVGSLRWQIVIRTKGGHSYNDFGNTNAIEAMSDLICRLYRIRLPKTGRNTYNAGVISGGTSVNTIAQSCSCLFECRSDTRENLSQMEQDFHLALSQLQNARPDIRLELSLVGERPCGHAVDPEKQQALTRRALASIEKISGQTPVIGSGSTDCNIPLSLGIPAVCFGGLMGGGVHTREEYVSIPALVQEARIIQDYLDNSIFS